MNTDAPTSLPVDERRLHTTHGAFNLRRGGSGPPMVVLHRDSGSAGWTEFHAQLAESFTVFAPAMPGFDGSDRPDWLRDVSQLAVVTAHILDALALGPVPVVGLGFGGWVAAEVMTLHPGRISAAVLQAPAGAKPREGEILDQFLLSAAAYVRAGFSDDALFTKLFTDEPVEDQIHTWELNREMVTRIAWKPYMYNAALPHLLRAVAAPVQLVRGNRDRVIPMSCIDVYAESLQNASVAEVEGGHHLELERPDVLVDHVRSFVKTQAKL